MLQAAEQADEARRLLESAQREHRGSSAGELLQTFVDDAAAAAQLLALAEKHAEADAAMVARLSRRVDDLRAAEMDAEARPRAEEAEWSTY